MPYNTKSIKKDLDAKPIPQYFNPTLDDYEPLLGANGANCVLLYDANGNPLLTAINPAYVQAEDGKIATIGAKADAAVTDPALSASEIALLKGLLKQLQGTGTGSQPVNLSAALPAGTNNIGDVDLASAIPAGDNLIGRVKLSDGTDVAGINADGSVLTDVIDRAARILGKITADDAAIAALGALAAAAVTDPTASASVIALLKGLLKQLQGTGTGSQPVSLTGALSARLVGRKI